MATERQQTQTERIIIALKKNTSLFHAQDGTCYGNFLVEAHYETYPLHSKGFQAHMARSYYNDNGKTFPNRKSLQEATELLQSEALYKGPKIPVFTRIAGHDNKIYLNLANETWEAVEIDADGWRIIPQTFTAFKFIKPPGLLPLPLPEKEGNIHELKELINMKNKDNIILVTSWLISAFHPAGPYPILVLTGEQGAAKSTIARMLQSLLDPSAVPSRELPRNMHDLMIAAKNSWILSFDNLADLSPRMSDAFCRLATGGGQSTRKLYTDDDEILFFAKRPIILNSIENITTRGDLADRAIVVSLPRIAPKARQREEVLSKKFEAAQPRLLGALLTAVSGALKHVDSVKLNEYPRMADLVHWIYAAEHGGLWEPGTFNKVYNKNIQQSANICLEYDPIAGALQEFMSHHIEWIGTATELNNALFHYIDKKTYKFSWVKNISKFSNRLRLLAEPLRKVTEINIIFVDNARPRQIVISNGKTQQSDVKDATDAYI